MLDPITMAVGGLVGGVALIGIATVGLPLLGFTGAGIAAGSVAASIHSSIGAVSAGSLFAILQSAGAAGIGSTALTALGGIGTLLGSLLTFGLF